MDIDQCVRWMTYRMSGGRDMVQIWRYAAGVFCSAKDSAVIFLLAKYLVAYHSVFAHFKGLFQ